MPPRSIRCANYPQCFGRENEIADLVGFKYKLIARGTAERRVAFGRNAQNEF
jgi:hypothetical protein